MAYLQMVTKLNRVIGSDNKNFFSALDHKSFWVTLRAGKLFGPIHGTIFFWLSVTVTLVFFGQNRPYLFVHKDGRPLALNPVLIYVHGTAG